MLANIGGDSDLFHELIRLFLDRYRPLVQDIDIDVHRSDSVALQQAAHTLKGTAANLCAATVIGVASDLEARGRRGNFDEANALLVELQHGIHQLVEALRQEQGYRFCSS
jgi:HPt (histidine-containing phosphotransfer) domain-containing protein